jgi:hypothetical protein
MSSKSDEADLGQAQLLQDIILHENDLTEEAKSRFSYHGEVLHGFDLYRRSVVRNNHLTPVGQHLLFCSLHQMHTLFKQVLNYVTENNEILNCSLPKMGPLVICGLPRTGTTLLYNLLACDPDCRALLHTEMYIESAPPISRSNVIEQERREAIAQFAAQQIGQLPGQTNEILASHPRFTYEEDLGLLQHASAFALFMTIITTDDQTDIDGYLHAEMEKNFAYDYHETFLRMSNSVDAPRSHWLLKSFFHVFYLDTLLRRYPHAAVVMTHRHLDEVLPSFFRTFLTLANTYFDKANSSSQEILKTRAMQFIDRMIKCIMKFRTRQSQSSDQSSKSIFDINYNELMEQPIATVRRIYNHFGFQWSDEFQAAMHAWLINNPQGKQGRHTYSLTEFGLTRDDIETRYADYINMFLRPSSSYATSNE